MLPALGGKYDDPPNAAAWKDQLGKHAAFLLPEGEAIDDRTVTPAQLAQLADKAKKASPPAAAFKPFKVARRPREFTRQAQPKQEPQ